MDKETVKQVLLAKDVTIYSEEKKHAYVGKLDEGSVDRLVGELCGEGDAPEPETPELEFEDEKAEDAIYLALPAISFLCPGCGKTLEWTDDRSVVWCRAVGEGSEKCQFFDRKFRLPQVKIELLPKEE